MSGTASAAAIAGTKKNLARQSAEIASYEKHLSAMRRRRDLLCLKLVTAGCSTREIGAVGGISSPAVTYASRRARAALAASTSPQPDGSTE